MHICYNHIFNARICKKVHLCRPDVQLQEKRNTLVCGENKGKFKASVDITRNQARFKDAPDSKRLAFRSIRSVMELLYLYLI